MFLATFKSSSSRPWKSESELPRLNPWFLKNLWEIIDEEILWKFDHFWTFEKIFKNQEWSLGSSNSDFQGLFDELLNMAKKHFFEKNENGKSYFFAPITR